MSERTPAPAPQRGPVENPKLRLRDRSVASGVSALALGAVALLAAGLRSEPLAHGLAYGALAAAALAAGFGAAWLLSACPRCGRRLLASSAAVVSPFRARCPHCSVVFHRRRPGH